MKGKNIFKQINNESGFTLMELIITIAIVAIAAGISGFGLNAVFNANLKNITYEFASDYRQTRYKTVSEFDTYYQMVMTYDTDKKRYGYKIQKYFEDPDNLGTWILIDVEQKSFRSSLVIQREYTDDNWMDLSDPSIDLANNPQRGTFVFEVSTGGIAERTLSTGVELESLILNGGSLGKFRFVNTRNNEIYQIDVIGETGRLVVYEK